MGVYLLLMTARITDRFLIEGSVYWIVIVLAGIVTYLGSIRDWKGGEEWQRYVFLFFSLFWQECCALEFYG